MFFFIENISFDKKDLGVPKYMFFDLTTLASHNIYDQHTLQIIRDEIWQDNFNKMSINIKAWVQTRPYGMKYLPYNIESHGCDVGQLVNKT